MIAPSKEITGEFRQANLESLLQYMVSSNRTGQLLLHPEGVNIGTPAVALSFDQGVLIAASCGETHAEAALGLALKWPSGSFEFSRVFTTIILLQDQIHRPLATILRQSDQNASERKQSEARAARIDPDFAPQQLNLGGDVHIQLSGRQYQLLMQINGQHTLRDLAVKLGIGLEETQSMVESLAQSGLIDLTRRVKVVAEPFLNDLRQGLTRIVGPLADLLIEDLIERAGWNERALHADQARKLLIALEHEVSPEQIELVQALGTNLHTQYGLHT